MQSIKRVIDEIHRRSLWQVLGIYLAGSWMALQAVDILAASAGLPEWFPSFALGLLIIGLPVVLATAFIQEGMSGDDGNAPVAAAGTGDGTTSGDAATSRAGAAGTDAAGAATPLRLLTWRNALLGGLGAMALWGVLATGWLLLGNRATQGSAAEPAAADLAIASLDEAPSVAVLPFAMRSAQPEDSFFVQGVHDDILTHLALIEDFKVISRTSVMRYADTDLSIGEIAGELGVSAVLEGGVQRAGDRVRVTAQLIDAETDGHLWAANYDEALTTENIFAIQTQIARAIADALEAHLTPTVDEHIAARPTENLEAYDLYNRARYLFAKMTIEDRLEALDLYRQAAALDSTFAAAHAEFGDTYLYLDARGALPAASDSGRQAAREAVNRALRLDPQLSKAHVAQGTLLEYLDDDLEGAERAYRRAVELSPGSVEAHQVLGNLLLNSGRIEEARKEFRRAAELNPLYLPALLQLAVADYLAGDFEEVEEQASRVVELDPEYDGGYYWLSAALTFQDRHEEAVTSMQRAVTLGPDDPYNRIALGFVHARAGNRDSALAIAADVEERGGSLKEIALVHAALGDIDRAFGYLERALVSNPIDIRALETDAAAEPLREDPRYEDLLRRAGVETE